MRTPAWVFILAASLHACTPPVDPPDSGVMVADSGVDAGVDSGTPDSGTPDAGPVDAGADAGIDGGVGDAGSPCPTGAPVSTGLTSYSPGSPVSCGYPVASLPAFYVAAPTSVYASARGCGMCAEMTGSNGTIVALVADLDFGDGGFFSAVTPAYRELTDAGAGRSTATWRMVPCDVGASPMSYRFQFFSTSFVSVSPMGHRWPIAVVEGRAVGTTSWTVLMRSMVLSQYTGNLSTPATGAFELRLTDIHGHVVIDTVPSIMTGTYTGTGQFPLTCK